MRAAVIMTVFDRPHYLKRVLASLDKLDGLRDLPLFFYVDGPYDAGSAERCSESVRLCKEFSHPQKTVTVRDKNVGIATQVYESKQAVFSSGYDAVVSLVDDIIIAPYGLEAMLTAYTTLQPYLALFTLDIFSLTHATRADKRSQLGVIQPSKTMATYIMPKEVWQHVGPILAEYIHKFIEPHYNARRPYRHRRARTVQQWFGSVVGQDSSHYTTVTDPKYPSSQDGCVYAGMLKHGVTTLATKVNHIGYIGEYGEHMKPEAYHARGFDKLVLHLFDRDDVLSALSAPIVRPPTACS